MRIRICIVAQILLLSSPGAIAHDRRRPTLDVAELSLAERCQAASLVAKSILEVLAFVDRVPSCVKPAPRLNLFLSQAGGGDDAQSIFRSGETCGEAWIRNPEHRKSEQARVEVNLAAGKAGDLPRNNAYLLISSETLGPDRWQFHWHLNGVISGCELTDESVSGMFSYPILELVVARKPPRSKGDDLVEVVRATVLLTRYDAGFDAKPK
jgi:hypothetical protein